MNGHIRHVFLHKISVKCITVSQVCKTVSHFDLWPFSTPHFKNIVLVSVMHYQSIHDTFTSLCFCHCYLMCNEIQSMDLCKTGGVKLAPSAGERAKLHSKEHMKNEVPTWPFDSLFSMHIKCITCILRHNSQSDQSEIKFIM